MPPIMLRTVPVRVLLIDDDPGVCRHAGQWLRAASYDAVTFTDPEEGLAHAAETTWLIALVDLRLNNIDGTEVLAKLHTLRPATRLIAITAFPDVAHVIAAMRTGARDLLEKPLQEASLLAAVGRQVIEAGIGMRNEQEFNQRLGARLRALRTQAERTLNDVADEAGLTAAQLSQIELGKSATSTWTLARLCSTLRVPLSRFWHGL